MAEQRHIEQIALGSGELFDISSPAVSHTVYTANSGAFFRNPLSEHKHGLLMQQGCMFSGLQAQRSVSFNALMTDLKQNFAHFALFAANICVFFCCVFMLFVYLLYSF